MTPVDNQRLLRQSGVIPNRALDTKVAILGTGGVGTWVAIGAAMMGVKRLVLIDDDTVAEHNLNRQFFTYNQIGMPKVSALADIIKSINPHVELFPYPNRIEALEEMPKDVDIVMCGVDNFETRFMLQEWANENKDKLVIDMGTTDNATGGTVLMMKYLETPSYKSFLGEEGVKAAEVEMRTPPCSRNPEPAIVTTTAMVAFLGLDLLRQVLTYRTLVKKVDDPKEKIYKGIFTVSLGRRPCVDFSAMDVKGWKG